MEGWLAGVWGGLARCLAVLRVVMCSAAPDYLLCNMTLRVLPRSEGMSMVT